MTGVESLRERWEGIAPDLGVAAAFTAVYWPTVAVVVGTRRTPGIVDSVRDVLGPTFVGLLLVTATVPAVPLVGVFSAVRFRLATPLLVIVWYSLVVYPPPSGLGAEIVGVWFLSGIALAGVVVLGAVEYGLGRAIRWLVRAGESATENA